MATIIPTIRSRRREADVKERWIFEVIQDGMVVAEGDCSDCETAVREAAHYCSQYGQDGPVKALVRRDDENFEPPTVDGEVV